MDVDECDCASCYDTRRYVDLVRINGLTPEEAQKELKKVDIGVPKRILKK